MKSHVSVIPLLSFALLFGIACGKKSSSRKSDPDAPKVEAVPVDIRERTQAFNDRADKSTTALVPQLERSLSHLYKVKAWVAVAGSTRLFEGQTGDSNPNFQRIAGQIVNLIFSEDHAYGMYDGYVLYRFDGLKEEVCDDASCKSLADSLRVGAQLSGEEGIKVNVFDLNYASILMLDLSEKSVTFDADTNKISKMVALLFSDEEKTAEAAPDLSTQGRLAGAFQIAADKSIFSLGIPEGLNLSSTETWEGRSIKTDLSLSPSDRLFTIEQDLLKVLANVSIDVKGIELSSNGNKASFNGFKAKLESDEFHTSSELTLLGGKSRVVFRDEDGHVNNMSLFMDKDWVIKIVAGNSEIASLTMSTVNARLVAGDYEIASLIVPTELQGQIKRGLLKITEGRLNFTVSGQPPFTLERGLCYGREKAADFEGREELSLEDSLAILPRGASCPAYFL